MTTTERPPAGIEYKAAALAAPAPSRSGTGGAFDLSAEPEGTVWAIVAVTGGEPDAVGDIIVPGALARTLRERGRDMKIVLGHDWNRPVGRVLSAVELLPGDPRLPRALGDGTPWPAANGALLVKARYILGTRDGRDAYEHAKAFGVSHAYSIGYKVTAGGARRRGGVRYITDLDVYEASPVLAGAHRHARLLAVKAGRPGGLQVKAAPVLPRRRAGTPVGTVTDCSACGRPTAAVVGGGLRSGESLVCAACVSGAYDDVRAGLLGEPGTDTAVIRPDELAAADEITAEEEFSAAMAGEIRYVLERDGTPVIETEDPARIGRSWTRRPPSSGWGRL